MFNPCSFNDITAEYDSIRIELENAEKDLEVAIRNVSAAHEQHDQAWYSYVRHASPDNYLKFERALDELHSAHEHCTQVRLNYKLAKCKFKKASRVFKRLQKREEKLCKKQRGE